jgi:hypothetical protein
VQLLWAQQAAYVIRSKWGFHYASLGNLGRLTNNAAESIKLIDLSDPRADGVKLVD